MTSKELFKAAWSGVRFCSTRGRKYHHDTTRLCFELAMTYTPATIKCSEEIYLRNLIPKTMLLLNKRNQPTVEHVKPITQHDRQFAILRSRNQRYSKGLWRFKFWAKNLKL